MAWQGNGMGAAWKRHAMCESALMGTFYLLQIHPIILCLAYLSSEILPLREIVAQA